MLLLAPIRKESNLDSDGNIYLFKNHPDPDAFVAEYDLAVIPDDEFSRVSNMSQQEKRNWYTAQKKLEAI